MVWLDLDIHSFTNERMGDYNRSDYKAMGVGNNVSYIYVCVCVCGADLAFPRDEMRIFGLGKMV